MPRLLLAFAAALSLLALGYLFLREDSASTPGITPTDSAREQAPLREELEGEGPATRATDPREEVDATPQPGPAVPEIAPAFVGPPSGAVRLTGTAVRIDPEGQEHGEEDGSFTLTTWSPQASLTHHVEVRAGRWGVFIDSGERLAARDLVLGEKSCVLERDSWQYEEGLTLALRGRDLATVNLHVLSARAGEELEGVIVLGMRPGDELADFPSETSRLAPYRDGATSPVAIEPDWISHAEKGDHSLWVGAPDHAWRALSIDHRTAGEREVRLEPGGELEVLLPEAEADGQRLLRVTLRAADGEAPPAEPLSAYSMPRSTIQLWSSRPVVLDGLEPTEWVVELFRRTGWPTAFDPGEETIARASCRIEAGRRTVVDLRALTIEEDARAVRVSGTVELPAGVAPADHPGALEFHSRTGGSFHGFRRVVVPLEGDPPFAWEAELPFPGSWWIVVQGGMQTSPRLHLGGAIVDSPVGSPAFSSTGRIHLVERLHVGPEGLSGLRLRPPELCEVSLTLSYRDSRMVDTYSRNGMVLPGHSVAWIPGGKAARSFSIAAFEIAPPGEPLEFRAPVGPITFWTGTFQKERHDILLSPGRNELTLHRPSERGVRFELADGKARVPWTPGLARASFVPVDGLGGPVLADRGSIRFSEPGAYLLRLEGLRDFEDVVDLVFEVPEEGWTEVRVPLRRRK